ncbi:MAG TPA: UDP-N-acetylmuramoyl-tripeptide--D-alanyl-D-alanine ligase, partial [Firmicutes bacterium]|nr:UDP-N-acetylmuramoyl-tripeptide--D-alanyl-D-alanine ligase [Bacillota bacterium]
MLQKMKLTTAEIIEAVNGQLLTGGLNESPAGFSIDTRTLKKGDFFVPLTGEKQDGHVFLNEAAAKGAMGAFIGLERLKEVVLPEKGVFIAVRNVLAALQSIASYYRSKFSVPVVAVTGSAGKTTTKDLTAAVLKTRYETLNTEGNYNNEIGLPLSLLKLRDYHRVAVLEMGMSDFGEIALLAGLAKPQVGIITNIGMAHLEIVKSIEGVARAKGELLEAMGSSGTAVLNGEDPRLIELGKGFAGKVVYYGFGANCSVRGENLAATGGKSCFFLVVPQGKIRVELPLAGRHNVLNALAAAAVGSLFDLSPEEIRAGLEKAAITAGRLKIDSYGGYVIINDTYNSNPTSARASLLALKDMAGKSRKGAVLGDMLELGAHAEKAHLDTGVLAASLGLDFVLTLG